MRCMSRSRRKVNEERFVRRDGLLLTDVSDRLVCQIFREVVTLLSRLLSLDWHGTVVERRTILTCFSADESIEVFKARTGGPTIVWANWGCFEDRHFMTLAKLRR